MQQAELAALREADYRRQAQMRGARQPGLEARIPDHQDASGDADKKGNGAAPKGNGCFECGAPRHFKRDCPKLKNKDGGNGNAQGWVYAVGNAEKRGNASGNPYANVVMDCNCFIDDILDLLNKDEKEHEEQLKAILELLKKEQLYDKFSKCHQRKIPHVFGLAEILPKDSSRDSKECLIQYETYSEKEIQIDWG
ncbi:putative reverse transcriptase domain-containing protein [Tanacetum coccineum]